MISSVYAKPVNGQPANRSDTICPTVETYQKLVIAAERKKVLEERISIIRDSISLLQQNVTLLNQKDSITLAGHKKEIGILEDEKKLLLDVVAQKNKELRRERRKRMVTGFAGIGATVLAFIIGSR